MQIGKFRVVISLMIILLISCKKETKVQLPFEIAKVVKVLGDMHFAKSASLVHKTEDRDSMRLIYESQVYEIHNITKKEYNKLKFVLESDLKLYYDVEKKVHKHLKDVQNNKK